MHFLNRALDVLIFILIISIESRLSNLAVTYNLSSSFVFARPDFREHLIFDLVPGTLSSELAKQVIPEIAYLLIDVPQSIDFVLDFRLAQHSGPIDKTKAVTRFIVSLIEPFLALLALY